MEAPYSPLYPLRHFHAIFSFDLSLTYFRPLKEMDTPASEGKRPLNLSTSAEVSYFQMMSLKASISQPPSPGPPLYWGFSGDCDCWTCSLTLPFFPLMPGRGPWKLPQTLGYLQRASSSRPAGSTMKNYREEEGTSLCVQWGENTCSESLPSTFCLLGKIWG